MYRSNIPTQARGIGSVGPQRAIDGIQSAVADVSKYVANNNRVGVVEQRNAFSFLGKIIATPSGSTAFTDARYWIRAVGPSSATNSEDALSMLTDYQIAHGNEFVVAATNLAELDAGTHATEVDTIVHVFCRIGTSDQGYEVHHFYFSHNFIPGAGDTQYQVLQMVTATTYGWDWVRFHAGT